MQPRQPQPYQPHDRRFERVADEHAEHDRDEHLLRPIQEIRRGGTGNDRQRDAADADVDRRRVALLPRLAADDLGNVRCHAHTAAFSVAIAAGWTDHLQARGLPVAVADQKPAELNAQIQKLAQRVVFKFKVAKAK